jgi:hypothetical protein
VTGPHPAPGNYFLKVDNVPKGTAEAEREKREKQVDLTYGL